MFYATWFRDRLSPNVSGTAVQKMYNGDYLKGKTPLIMVEFHQYENICYISMIDITFDVSRGQKSILTK